MIPLAKFADIAPPADDEVNRVRDECEAVIQQFRNCMRCRADAIGIPGEEGCGGSGDGSDESCGTGIEQLRQRACTPRFLDDKTVIRTATDDSSPTA
jgi:MoaA/NifB/PqqE/SkfB family radical SAM enzyme